MKNPIIKINNTTLIIAIAAGALTTGALAWFFLTEHSSAKRKNIKHKIKDKAKDLAADAVSKKTGLKKKTVSHIAGHNVE
jgi:hypothetical protein